MNEQQTKKKTQQLDSLPDPSLKFYDLDSVILPLFCCCPRSHALPGALDSGVSGTRHLVRSPSSAAVYQLSAPPARDDVRAPPKAERVLQ